MIQFKFTKTNGAQYLSHLDILRHITRTFRRAKIEVLTSQGFNKRMQLYFSPPLPLGIESICEYCAVNCDIEASLFKDRFNKVAAEGISCLDAQYVEKNPNFAGIITAAQYQIEGINYFDVQDILNKNSIILTDNKQKQKEIRPNIYKLYFNNDKLICVAGVGGNNLRMDLFADYLSQNYGANNIKILKTAAITQNGNLF